MKAAHVPAPAATASLAQPGLLQRQCACSRCSTGSCEDRLQAELVIGASNDPLEQEADRVADQVLAAPAGGDHSLRIQRASAQASDASTAVPASVHQSLASAGSPLEPGLRRDMERRFGHDFAGVRVHADTVAERSARDVQAHAYTVGRDVVFGAGQFAPATPRGRRLLAHELTHVVQQSRAPALQRKAVTPDVDEEDRSRQILQRDFALEPPRPNANARVLTAAELQAAIDFNRIVVTVIGAGGVGKLRDVLGIAPDPAVIDGDFVEAVLRWQAVQGLTQDGKLGPGTARPLFREIGAEGAGKGKLVSGPTYRPVTTLAPAVVAGAQQATFNFNAEFEDDPVNGFFASCCEVRQFIQWDAAYAAAAPGGPIHAGFPAGTAADTWIEDRDAADTRYGHRTDSHSALGTGDEYIDSTGVRNAAFGNVYHGQDNPTTHRHAGHWRFMVSVVDLCNGGRTLGQDFLRVTW